MGKSGRKLLLLRQKRKKVLNWREEKQPLSRKQKLSLKQKLPLLQPRRKLQMTRKPKKPLLLKLPPPKLPPTKPPLQKLPPPKLPQRKNTTVSKNRRSDSEGQRYSGKEQKFNAAKRREI